MTAPPRRCRCGHPGEKASRALPSGRPSGLPPGNAPPSAPTPRPGAPAACASVAPTGDVVSLGSGGGAIGCGVDSALPVIHDHHDAIELAIAPPLPKDKYAAHQLFLAR